MRAIVGVIDVVLLGPFVTAGVVGTVPATIVAAKSRRFDATSSTVQRSITVAEVAERARQNRVGTAPRAQSTGAGPEAKNNDVLQGEMS